MTALESYMANAAAEREAAERTTLPNRRVMHQRSAMAWEEMAAAAEDNVTKTAVNAAAKAKATG